MKVWVKQCQFAVEDVVCVSLGEPPNARGFRHERHSVEGAGGMVLADRAGLLIALSEDDTGHCAWHDCEFEPAAMFGHPHSGTCPLREQEGAG